MLEVGNELCGFTVQSTEDLPEIDGQAIVMNHAASGAKLLYLQNEDENKAFSITFKTPPKDDTGVFHILEHSVLCGSDKFPVKEPFVNLLRTSMQTFLNAMTFPDKTMYPVASTNEQDLLNLMDVYLDAVLHPMLHTDKHIFEQEGWHYELVDANAEDGGSAGAGGSQNKQLVYNGVVFNEMKGALADPESVLYHAMNRALFPNTCYVFESGGHPRAIPQLTYEDYCSAHARHYRLDNSYIVLYGDMDIDRVLGFLDEKYLGRTAGARGEQGTGYCSHSGGAINPMGEIAPVLSFGNTVEMATAPENAMVGVGYVIGPAHDFQRVLACDILLDALMGGNESPIKRAILDAGIGGDCTAYLIDAQEQPVALFLLKNAKPGVAQQFRELVEAEVHKLVEGGIPRDVLEASLSQMAFALRERDRGMADGVVLAMNAMSGWLYNDVDATTYLHFEEPLAAMRAGLDGHYFEDVLGSLVLEANHAALVDLQPAQTGDAAAEEAELAAKLAQLDEGALEAIDAEVQALRARQEAPDAPEALATLPQLHVADIGPAKPELAPELREDTPVPCLYHNLPTHHIAYVYQYFNLKHLTWDDVLYVTLLAVLLGNLDTAEHTAAELDVYSRQHLGRMNFFSDAHLNHTNPDEFSFRFAVGASALAEELEYAVRIPAEVMSSTRFSDKARVRDLLVQKRIMLEESFVSEGHVRAMARASSYAFKSGVLAEALGGIDFYFFLKDLLDHFDERFEELQARLEDLSARIFTLDNCLVSFTGSPEEYETYWQLWRKSGEGYCLRPCSDEAAEAEDSTNNNPSPVRNLEIPAPVNKCEGFTVPTDVCFVAKAADLGPVDYSGSWTVLGRVMGFDYLWNEVRVKGGAYGCGFRSSQSGHARFFSFRDPQLDATLQRFNEAGQWLADFQPTEDEMEGYIVSSVATHDAPQKPRAIARRQDTAYFAQRPENWREHMRETLLAATPESVRALAPKLDEMANSDAVCVFGNADIIRNAKEPLVTISLLEG